MYGQPAIPASAPALDFEFAGTLNQPLIFNGIAPYSVVPFGTAASRATYSSAGGVTISGSVGLIEIASASVGNHITSFTFWNLQACGNSITFGFLPSLTSMAYPELLEVFSSINTSTFLLCTSYTMPKLKYVGNQYGPDTFPVLTSLACPEMLYCGGRFIPNTMALLTTLSFPKLAFVGGAFQPQTFAALTDLTFSLLESVLGNFAPNTMALVTTFSFPALKYVGGTFAPTTMAALVTLSINTLEEIVGAASVASMASLTTVSLSGMKNYQSTITMNSGLGNVTSVTLGTIGTLKSIQGATVNLSGQKLTTANVNAILALLVSLDGTNGTTLWGAGKTLNVSGGTSGAPSGQGIVDKATLQARGATITTN
jgi:hypothetical protein